MIRVLAGVFMAFLPAVGAQEAARTAALSGIVTDSLQQPISDVEVAIPGLRLSVRTNEWGGFRIPNISPGAHQVTVRRVGYGPLEIELEFEPGATVQRRIVLFRSHLLEEILVVADARDVRMEQFEEHRRMGLGRFVTREQLARMEGHPTTSVLAQLGGVDVRRGSGNHAWVTTRRPRHALPSGGAIPGTEGRSLTLDDILRGARAACYSNVYLDNLLVYGGQRDQPLFNVNSIAPEQIEAIEFYAGPAQTPLRYSALDTKCGVLVIHTRRYFEKAKP